MLGTTMSIRDGLFLRRRFFSVCGRRLSAGVFLGAVCVRLLVVRRVFLLARRGGVLVLVLRTLGVAVLQFVGDEIVEGDDAADERGDVDDQHLVVCRHVDGSHE